MENRKTDNPIAITGGFYIPDDLFLYATGLKDERNNASEVRLFMEKHRFHSIHKGYIWYHHALILAKAFQTDGRFWMYQEDIAEHILNFFDDMIASGRAILTYK